mmetsp:Transcript_13409/g.25756  ORF Transcript_13409/g.25756 Transcript_13409/m.25756 type:complete len:298 (-) Transcript_13409:637-1530(-)
MLPSLECGSRAPRINPTSTWTDSNPRCFCAPARWTPPPSPTRPPRQCPTGTPFWTPRHPHLRSLARQLRRPTRICILARDLGLRTCTMRGCRPWQRITSPPPPPPGRRATPPPSARPSPPPTRSGQAPSQRTIRSWMQAPSPPWQRSTPKRPDKTGPTEPAGKSDAATTSPLHPRLCISPEQAQRPVVQRREMQQQGNKTQRTPSTRPGLHPLWSNQRRACAVRARRKASWGVSCAPSAPTASARRSAKCRVKSSSTVETVRRWMSLPSPCSDSTISGWPGTNMSTKRLASSWPWSS